MHLEDGQFGSPSAQKAQEMLCYLLIRRDRPHRREALTHLLWPTSSAAHAAKSFRQTLWQLRTALVDESASASEFLQVDLEWIGLHPEAHVWLDVSEFERVSRAARGVDGHELSDSLSEQVRAVLDLYRGDLLEGWDQDWCVFERERLRQAYLALLGKEIAYCETHALYEEGIAYGVRALRCEVAHERAHRTLMRLYYLSGDRTAALRQYERCVTLLRQELDVGPSQRTVTLYERIRLGRPPESRDGAPYRALLTAPDTPLTVSQTLGRLKQAQMVFQQIGSQIQDAICALEATSPDGPAPSYPIDALHRHSYREARIESRSRADAPTDAA
jgi:DNA-binding SARP family transcriptional activator